MTQTLSRSLLFALVLTGSCADDSKAQVGPCDERINAASEVLHDLMDTAATGDFRALKAYVEASWRTGDQHASARHLALLDLGTLILQSNGHIQEAVCAEGDLIASGYYHNRLTRAIDRIRIELDDASRPLIARVQVRNAIRFDQIPSEPLTDAERVAELREYVQGLYDHGAFSGVVLVARSGDPLFFEAFGWANVEDETPMRTDDAFNLASLNKIFTAVSIMQLVEQGRLSLEDSLSALLPEDVESEEAGTIQVKHLLSHTSGAMSGLSALSFSPGTSYAYSNYGYVPLGKIIETVSGMRYEDYLRLYVLGPSGMARTSRYEIKEPATALVTGYEPEIVDDALVLVPNPWLQKYPGGPVGGYYSTAEDLLRFAESLKSGLLLDRAAVDLMRTPKPELGAERYGYGVMRWRGPGIWGHAGNLPGTGADLEIYGDTEYVAVVLSNGNYLNPPVLAKIRALFYPRSLVVDQ